MDFKKFGNVVLILGIVVLVYGGLQWGSGQRTMIEPAKSSGSAFMDKFIRDTTNVEEGMRRSRIQDDAVKILIAGGIVALVGLGISYSSKRKE